MKCIHCNNDARYKDRSGGKCPSCGRAFAFEPKNGDLVTDGAFKSALDRVSASGTVKWTKQHLYYELARRKRGTWAVTIVFGVLGTLLMIVGVVKSPFFAFVALVLWAAATFGVPSRVTRLPPATFERLWTLWVAAHSEPPALIVRKTLPAATRALPADIQEYSFDRAVICDRPETVDLLLANNFHFENNCAVLSAGGYPPHAFETVRAMLKKNPKLVAYIVHDATPEGCALAHRITASKDWFHGRVHVVDVGLSPHHARRFKGCWRPQGGATVPNPHLSRADNAWLERYWLELAVIRPEQVIKRLFRAISGTPESFDAPDGGAAFDGAAFDGDATVSDGGGDSFG
jgi:hypothetical protein